MRGMSPPRKPEGNVTPAQAVSEVHKDKTEPIRPERGTEARRKSSSPPTGIAVGVGRAQVPRQL